MFILGDQSFKCLDDCSSSWEQIEDTVVLLHIEGQSNKT